MRKFFKIVGFAVLSVAGCVVLLVAAAYSMGTVTVSVENKRHDGPHVYVPVPAAVIPLAMRLAPAEDLADAAAQVRHWLPAIKVASEELTRCPNATLVEVTSADERVRITKDHDSIVIDVDSPEEDLHVSLPLETAYSVACQLEVMNESANRPGKRKPGVIQGEELESTN